MSSNNPLEMIRALIFGSTATMKIMTVVSLVVPDSVAVEANGERCVVKGNYKIGAELMINGNTVIGICESEIKRHYRE